MEIINEQIIAICIARDESCKKYGAKKKKDTNTNDDSVQFSRSVVSGSLRHHDLQHARPPCPSPSPGVHPNSCIKLVMSSSHLILCRPLLLLPRIPPSIRVFSNESTLRMKWLKYWSFRYKIQSQIWCHVIFCSSFMFRPECNYLGPVWIIINFWKEIIL